MVCKKIFTNLCVGFKVSGARFDIYMLSLILQSFKYFFIMFAMRKREVCPNFVVETSDGAIRSVPNKNLNILRHCIVNEPVYGEEKKREKKIL